MQRSSDSLEVTFVVTDLNQSVTITYRGTLPDLFREGQGIVALGKLKENGAWRSDWLWINVAQPAAWGQFVFLLFAFSCLVYAFVTDDFSVAYVASNSNSALPWYYKFSATWGAHEGSLLFSNVRRKLPQLAPSP